MNSRIFEKKLADGKISVPSIEECCQDEETWDKLSTGIGEINDDLFIDVAEQDDKISSVNHYWDFKTPNQETAKTVVKAAVSQKTDDVDLSSFKTDPESTSRGVGARLGFLAKKFPKEDSQEDLEK